MASRARCAWGRAAVVSGCAGVALLLLWAFFGEPGEIDPGPGVPDTPTDSRAADRIPARDRSPLAPIPTHGAPIPAAEPPAPPTVAQRGIFGRIRFTGSDSGRALADVGASPAVAAKISLAVSVVGTVGMRVLTASTQVADDGAFQFADLPNGEYSVSFSPRTGYLAVQQAVRAVLSDGSPSAHVEIAVVRIPQVLAELMVRVRRHGGTAIGGASIRFGPYAGETDAAGQLRLTAIPLADVGTVEVSVSGLPLWTAQVLSLMAPADRVGAFFDPSRVPATVDVILPARLLRVRGSVSVSSGDMPPDTEVVVQSAVQRGVARVQSDGTFYLEQVWPGPSRVMVTAPGCFQADAAGGMVPYAMLPQPEADDDQVDVTLFAVHGREIVVEVVDGATGAGIPAAWLELRHRAPSGGAAMSSFATTDAEGRARIVIPMAGDSDVTASAGPLGYERSGAYVASTPGVRIALWRVADAANRACRLQGLVASEMSRRGEPPTRLDQLVVCVAELVPTDSPRLGGRRVTAVSSKGRFECDHLPVGTYAVTAWAPDGRSSAAEVVVLGGGSSAIVELRIPQVDTWLTIEVIDSAGVALADVDVWEVLTATLPGDGRALEAARCPLGRTSGGGRLRVPVGVREKLLELERAGGSSIRVVVPPNAAAPASPIAIRFPPEQPPVLVLAFHDIESGAEVQGVRVQLARVGAPASPPIVREGVRGAARVPLPMGGTYRLRADASGYQSVARDIDLRHAQRLVIAMTRTP